MANTVAVLGGGTGGIVVAHRLRRELAREDRVVLVERDPVYRFAPQPCEQRANIETCPRVPARDRRLLHGQGECQICREFWEAL